mmetsp:Transcript_67441/g.161792  ORF Transcript_67441/g.161792 Transcript_67441/m.161792 type:complete len:170 (-) Transcript_67441:51-560(-)
MAAAADDAPQHSEDDVELQVAYGTERLILSLPRTSSVAEAQRLLAELISHPVEELVLIHRGSKLTEGTTQLRELMPQPTSTSLRMMLMSRGGRMEQQQKQPRHASLWQRWRKSLQSWLEECWAVLCCFWRYLFYPAAWAPEPKNKGHVHGNPEMDFVRLAAACGAMGGG